MEEEKPPVSVGGLTLPDILVLSIQALTSSLLPLSVYMMPVTMVSGKRGNTFRLTSTKIWKEEILYLSLPSFPQSLFFTKL